MGPKIDPRWPRDRSKTIFKSFFFRLRFCLRFWSLLGRILAPSWAPFGLQKLSQVGCLPGPVESKTTLDDQDGPRPIQDGLQTPQDPPRPLQEPPKTPQDPKKIPPDPPKRPKIDPRHPPNDQKIDTRPSNKHIQQRYAIKICNNDIQ